MCKAVHLDVSIKVHVHFGRECLVGQLCPSVAIVGEHGI